MFVDGEYPVERKYDSSSKWGGLLDWSFSAQEELKSIAQVEEMACSRRTDS